jgi:gliding motility-associated-like protein
MLTSSNVGGLAASYIWRRNGTATGDVGASITLTTVAQSGNYTVEVVGVAPSNCTSPPSDPTPVTIHPLPSAPNPTGGGAVCAGNPAPNIVWTGLTGTPPFNVTYTISGVPNGPFVEPTTTFTISNPLAPGIYQISALTDANGCPAAGLGGTASVTIGGSAPVFDSGPSLTPTTTCDDGGATTDPQLLFSLDNAGSAGQIGFILTYRVDGGANRIKNFNTTVVTADPTAPVTFNDAEFNSSVPAPHVLRIVSIQSPSGCQSIFNIDINFRVNPRPPPPANPVNGVACSSDPTGATISVDAPVAGNLILWFTNAAGTIAAVGVTGGVRQEQFTPASNATQTYFAYTESQTAPTLCKSTTGTAVQHTRDLNPTAAANFPDFSTCNTTATLTATPADNGGSGLWTIGGSVYYESFPSTDNGLGITGPSGAATFNHPGGNWDVSVPAGALLDATDWIRVDGGKIVARDITNMEAVWRSEIINLTGAVDIKADIAETGVQAAGDYVRVFYKINGGGEIQFGGIDDDAAVDATFQTESVTGIGIAGNTLQIVMRASNNGATDEHWLDNVIVSSAGVALPVIADPSDEASTVSNLQVGPNTFTWTITSALGACLPTFDLVTITRNPLPAALDPLPQLCEDSFGSTDATITPAYLASAAITDAVTGIPGSANRTVQFFTDAARTMAVPAIYLVSTSDIIYTRVTKTDLLPNCTADGIITFTVNPLPVANDQAFPVCEETVGSNNKDNNNLPALFDNLITGGVANRTVTWYFDPGVPVTGPGDLVTVIPTPNDVDAVADGTFFYALVENTITNCQNVAAVEFDIQPRPTANLIVGQPNVCASNALVVYQLSSVVPGSTYAWTLPANNPGFFEVVFGGGVNDFFVGLRFPGLTAPPASDIYNISVIETSPVASGACAGDQNNFVISVDSSPAANPITGPDPVCKNQTGQIYQVTFPNAGNTYAWSITAGDAAIVGPAAGVGRTSIVVDFGTSNSSTISVVESSPTGCSLAAPQTIIVNAFDTPVMTSTSTFSMCSGQAPATAPAPLIFTAAPGGNSFTWRVLNVPATVSGAVVGNTGIGNINQVLTNVSGVIGVVTYEVTPRATVAPFCAGPPQNVFVTVEPEPIIVAGQTKTVCSNSPVNYHVSLSPAGLPANTRYSWPDPDGAGPASAGVNVPESNAFTITDVLVNLTGVPFDVTYVITPTVNGGLNCTTLPAVSVVVTVDPQPIIVPGQTKTICSGSTVDYHVDLNPAGLPANTRYSWPDPDGAGPASAGVSVPESNAFTLTDALVNTTGVAFDVTYMIVPRVNGGLNCTTLPAVPVVITVEPQPVIAAGQAKTICSGTGVDYHVNLIPVGLPANTRYNWPDPDGAGPATAGVTVPESNALTITDVLTNTTGANITVTYIITPTVNSGLNCTTLPPVPVVITIEPQPIIIPGQTKTICSGSNVDYHVNLVPVGLPVNTVYNWPDPDGAGPATAGVNVAELSALTITDALTNTTGANLFVAYMITPTVNSGLNCSTLPPVPVVITVEPQPVIAAGQTKTICSGSGVDYHVNLIPGSLPANTRYSWPDPDGAGPATAGINIPESNALTITDALTNTTGAAFNVTYMITPTVNAGLNCSTLPAVPVVITVEPQPIIAAGQTKTICGGTSVDYHVNLLPGGLPANTQYSWPDPDGAGPATAGASVPESNALTITDLLTNTTGVPFNVTYMITPTVNGGLNCTTLPPVSVVIVVEPQPVIAAGQTKTICGGTNVNYHVNLVPGTLPANTQYSWPDPDGAGPATAGLNIPESNALTIIDLLTNTTGAPFDVTYVITPTVNGGLNCTTLPPVQVVITVEPQPVIVPAQVKTICSGSAVDYHVNLTPVGLPANTEYSWPDPDGAGPATAGVSIPESNGLTITDVLTNTTGANLTVTYMITPIVNGGLNCTKLPAVPVVITVEPQPIIVANQVKTICSGSNVNYHVNLLPAGLPANTRYSWPDPDGAGPATAGINVPESNALTIIDLLTNTTGADITVTYMITPTVNGGLNCTTLPAVSVVITVEPQPVIVAGQVKTICSGSAVDYHVNLIPAGLPSNTRYSWPDPDGAGPATAGVNVPEASALTITDVLTNTTGSNITVTYMVTPTVNGGLNCSTLPAVPVVITVEPQPVIAPTQTKTICSGSAVNYHVNLLPAALPSNTRYSWPDPDGAGPASAGVNIPELNALTITDVLTNTTGAALTVTYMITPTVNGGLNCTTLPAVPIVITVEPQPIIAPGQVKTICSGDNVNYHVNLIPGGLPANTRYSWGAPTMSDASVQGSGGVNVPESNALTITDALVNLTGADITATYNMTPTVNGGFNCTTLPPVAVVITIQSAPVAQALSTIERCSGDPIAFDIQDIINNVAPFVGGNSVNSKFSYTVIADFPLDVAPAVFPGLFDRVVATGANISETFSNFSGHDVKLTYTITPTSDPQNCLGVPFTLEVIIHPEPVGSNLIDPVCSTSLNHNIQTQITNPAPGLLSIFTYTVSSDNGGVLAGPDRVVASNAFITDIYVNGTGNPANITYTITPFNAAHPTCAGTPFTYTVNISPNPTGVSDAKPAECSDVPFAIDPQANIVPPVASTFTWTAIYDFGLTGGAASGTGMITGALHNETGAPLLAHYTVIPSAGTCVGASFTIDVPINPEPVMLPGLATLPALCSTNAVSTTPIGVILDTNGLSVVADSYIVTLKSQDAGLVGIPTTGTFPANSPLPGQSDALGLDTYRNTTSAQLKVVYTVVPVSADGCQGDPFDLPILINSEPVLDSPIFPAVCSSNAGISNPINIVLGTNGTSANATSYEVKDIQYDDGGGFSVVLPANFTANPTNSIVGATGTINLVKSDRFTNRRATPVTVRFSVQGFSSQGCASEYFDYTVVINPEPVLDPTLSPAPLCSDVISGVTLVEQPGSAVAATFNINNIIRQPGLVAGGSNASIGLGQANNVIFNDIFTNTTSSPLTVTYKVAPVTLGGCIGAEADVVFTVNPAPAVDDNLNKTVCSDGTVGIVFATETSPASVAAASYNIITITVQAGLVRTAGNPAFPRNGVTANDIQADQFRNPTNDPLIVTYGVQAVSGAPCLGPIRNIILTVEPEIIAAPINNAPTICSTALTDIDLISPTNPTSGVVTFNYTAVSSVGGLISGFVPALNNLPENYKIGDALVNNSDNPATVTYSISAVANGARNGAGCSSLPPAVDIVVTVEPKPKLIATPSVQTVCEGIATAVALNSNTVPSAGNVRFELLSATASGGVTGMSAVGTLFNPGASLADVLDNPTITAQTVTYTFQPRIIGGLGCAGDNVVVTITVNPLPTIIASAQPDICSGDFINITLTPDVANTVATWTVSAPVTIVGESNGAGNLIFQTLFNNGTIPETVTYTVTPRVNGCNGTPILVNVVVNPKPAIVGLPNMTTVCHGATLNVPLNSTVAGTTFDWVVDDPSGLGVPPVGSGNVINQPLTNTTGSQASLTYTITPTGPGACLGDQKILIVTVSPQMDALFVNPSSSICKGSSEFLIIQLDGQAPFQLVYNDGTSDITVNNAGNFKVIQVTPAATTTYTLVSARDAFNCLFTPVGQSVTVTVGETDANFSIVGPASSCGPYNATFQFNQVAGTQYTWQWFDGAPDEVFLAATTIPNNTISHVFTNPNPNAAITYKVTLRTELPAPFPGCFKTQTNNVTVFPSIITNAFPDRSEICSGENIQFFNQSFGATSHTWFYRVQGTATAIDIRNTPTVNYNFVNTSTTNPIIYEVVYQANNGNCPAADVVIPITVYRAITAGFDEGTIPPFIGGNSTVTFTNTSTPIDITQFRYEWTFGLNSTPATGNGAGPFPVNYSSPGPRDISLKVVNIAAEAAFLGCESSFTKTINIPLLPLVAAFKADPLRGCFPSNITVTENTSTGDVMEWRVVDSNGRIAATSNAPLPVFQITNPGNYSIFLTTSNSLTGQVANTQQDNFEVFDNPVASFDLRPTTVFVPDTELTTFNFSTGATDYDWDFGDGGTSFDVEPIYVYKVEGAYDVRLIARNDHGQGVVCTDTLIRKVTAKQGGVTKVPNAFTPNPNGPSGGNVGAGSGGNGTFNDVFLPIVKGAEEFNMQIFDRWGNLIFESNSNSVGWDGYDANGKLMPAGVYVYKLTVRLSDGQRSTQIGDVTMIR